MNSQVIKIKRWSNDQTIITAYRGKCCVDPASYQVVRLEKEAVDIP